MNQQVPGELPIQIHTTVQALNIILAGLGKLPYESVNRIVNDLQIQGDMAVAKFLEELEAKKKADEEYQKRKNQNTGSARTD